MIFKSTSFSKFSSAAAGKDLKEKMNIVHST